MYLISISVHGTPFFFFLSSVLILYKEEEDEEEEEEQEEEEVNKLFKWKSSILGSRVEWAVL